MNSQNLFAWNQRLRFRSQSATWAANLAAMKTLTATDVARNFRSVLDAVEREQEEVVVVRNRRQVARLVPEPLEQNALEVLSDLVSKLDEKTGASLTEAIRKSRKSHSGTLSELRNPWAS